MKKHSLLIYILGILLILTSCDKKNDVYITCLTGPATAALYPLGMDVCNIWNSKIKHVTSEAHVSAGGVENLELLKKGETQVCMAISRNCFESYTGTGYFKGNPNKNLRVIAGLYLNPNNLVVLKDSDINNLRDLYGKNFSSGPLGSSTEGEAMYHLEAAGLNYQNDIKIQNTDFDVAVENMKSKSIDGAWMMAGLGNEAVTEACANANAKILDIDPDVISILLTKYPWYSEFTIPAGTYPNQTENVHTTAIQMLMVTTADLDEDTVYAMTKVFWKNINKLIKNSPSLNGVTVETALDGIANLPIHPGAEKFYIESGLISK